MTLRDAVARTAQEFDRVKPGWEKLVPLEPGKVDMSAGCAPCIADYVFAEEAAGLKNGYGYLWCRRNVVTDDWKEATLDGWLVLCDDDELLYWREEIVTRLARFTPAPVAETVEAE